MADLPRARAASPAGMAACRRCTSRSAMLSAFCAKAVEQKRKRQLQKIAKETKVRESQRNFVNFVSFCSRFLESWVVFIHLTSSFRVCASGLSAVTRLFVHIEVACTDLFYGIQGKFLTIF